MLENIGPNPVTSIQLKARPRKPSGDESVKRVRTVDGLEKTFFALPSLSLSLLLKSWALPFHGSHHGFLFPRLIERTICYRIQRKGGKGRRRTKTSLDVCCLSFFSPELECLSTVLSVVGQSECGHRYTYAVRTVQCKEERGERTQLAISIDLSDQVANSRQVSRFSHHMHC